MDRHDVKCGLQEALSSVRLINNVPYYDKIAFEYYCANVDGRAATAFAALSNPNSEAAQAAKKAVADTNAAAEAKAEADAKKADAMLKAKAAAQKSYDDAFNAARNAVVATTCCKSGSPLEKLLKETLDQYCNVQKYRPEWSGRVEGSLSLVARQDTGNKKWGCYETNKPNPVTYFGAPILTEINGIIKDIDPIRAVAEVAAMRDTQKDNEKWKETKAWADREITAAKKIAEEAFRASTVLKQLGETALAASKAFLERAKNIRKNGTSFTAFLGEVVGSGMKGIAGDLSNALDQGAKISVNEAQLIVKKLKEPDNFGDPKTWNSAVFSSLGQMTKILEVPDIQAVPRESIQAGMGSIRKAFKNARGLTATQKAAWKTKVNEAYGATKDMTTETVEELGPMMGTLELKVLPEEALPSIKASAIKVKGGADFASWSPDRLKMLSKTAIKEGFNGQILKDFRSGLTRITEDEKVQASEMVQAVVCPDGGCPGAICDCEVRSSGGTNGEDIMEKCTPKSITPKKATIISETEDTSLDNDPDTGTGSGARRRRRRRRHLLAETSSNTTSNNTVTTVRLECVSSGRRRT